MKRTEAQNLENGESPVVLTWGPPELHHVAALVRRVLRLRADAPVDWQAASGLSVAVLDLMESLPVEAGLSVEGPNSAKVFDALQRLHAFARHAAKLLKVSRAALGDGCALTQIGAADPVELVTDAWAQALERIADTLESTAKQADKRPAKTSKGIAVEEANVLARVYLRKHPKAHARDLVKGIGCSLGLVSKLPAWQAVLGEREKGRAPKALTAVSLPEKSSAACYVVGDANTILNKLAAEQKADGQSDGSIRPFGKRGRSNFIQRRKV